MRGLIIKDILFIKNTWKNLLIIFIGSLLLSIALGNYLLAICSVPIILLTSGINTFQTDEFYNTDAYTLSYPLSRRKIVTSKYLFTLVMMLISTYIGLMIYASINVVINPGVRGLNTDMLKQLLMLEISSLLVDAIFYPIIYKYGCEKSKFVLMSIVMLLLGVGSILSVYINIFKKATVNFEGIITFIDNYGLISLTILVIVASLISYGLSILAYRHKDF
ncbi:MAG: ABC-2 transporter permease [Bacilli bacterium]|nr:ABC-2 transporter permease [Bacilli bacterium]